MPNDEYNDYELDWPDNEAPNTTVVGFLAKLEKFLEETLDEDSRGNVFLSDNGENGVALNVLVGASFEHDSSHDEINQVNVIIAPTDRDFLGSEDVNLHARVETDDPNFKVEVEDEDLDTAFDEAIGFLDEPGT